jgi:multidrug efflux system membrane fusion protein
MAYARDSQEVLATGRVLLDNQINTTNGTVQLKARFDNAEHKLWPGQYVNARLQMNSHGNALTVPAAAIQRNQQGTYVYAISQDDKANMHPVKVDRIQDGVAVLGADSGLTGPARGHRRPVQAQAGQPHRGEQAAAAQGCCSCAWRQC